MSTRCLIRFIVILFIFWGSRQATAQDWIYATQPGDTLWDLCLEYTAKRGCWKELGTYNNISGDRIVQPGTEIRIPLDWLLELPIVGTVLSVQGEVQYQEQSGGKLVPLVPGQTLVLGSLINSRAGNASIILNDHSELLLRPDSVLELSSMSTGTGLRQSSELDLDRGEVEVKVKPGARSRFEIHTPSAIAAVRGTEYRVASLRRDAGTRSEVLKGEVAVEAGTTVEVPAGYGLKAKKDEVPGEPRELPAAPVFAQARVDSPLPLSVHWTNEQGVVSWHLDLYSQAAPGELLATYRTADPELVFTELGEGCYRLVARGIDSEGFNGLESELPLCVKEPQTYWDLLLWSTFTAIIMI